MSSGRFEQSIEALHEGGMEERWIRRFSDEHGRTMVLDSVQSTHRFGPAPLLTESSRLFLLALPSTISPSPSPSPPINVPLPWTLSANMHLHLDTFALVEGASGERYGIFMRTAGASLSLFNDRIVLPLPKMFAPIGFGESQVDQEEEEEGWSFHVTLRLPPLLGGDVLISYRGHMALTSE